jgi:PleD family two-component response regulator
MPNTPIEVAHASLERLDAALYVAKNEGRDLVRIGKR